MAENHELKTRLVLCGKTEDQWKNYDVVPMKGELAISLDKRKIKVGDGSNKWNDLLYINLTPEEVQDLIERLIDENVHTFVNQETLDKIEVALTSKMWNSINSSIDSLKDNKVDKTVKVNGHALSGDITITASDITGVATLDDTGKVPATQLPSYVDDVVEGYINGNKFYKKRKGTTSFTYEDEYEISTDKIYVDLSDNKTYRWSGTTFTEISSSLALGETSETAFPGDKGKIAYDYATTDHGFITSDSNVASATKLKTERKIDGVNFDGSEDITHYGTCSTYASTRTKIVSLTKFDLVTGSRVFVKFSNTNTATNPLLNVNNTGAKAIYYRGSSITASVLVANRVYEFVYDGTYWQFVGDINTDTTYSAGTGLTMGNNNVINHSNSVTAGTAKGSDSKTLKFGDTFTIPTVSYDAQGHITGSGTSTITMPTSPEAVSGNAGSATKLASAQNFSIIGGATAQEVSFDGTQAVQLNVTAVSTSALYVPDGDTLILNGTF